MNYEKMTKAELISKLKSLESGIDNSRCMEDEITLQGSEEKYQKFIETIGGAVFLVDVETEIILATNKRAEELLGVPVEKIVGMNRSQMYPPEDIERYDKIFQKSVKTNGVITTEDIFIQHRDGRKIPVEISSNAFKRSDRKVLHAAFRDITERKKINAERLRLTKILEMTSDLVGTATVDGNITYLNRSGKKMIGWRDDFKLNSKKIQDVHPEWAFRIVMDKGIPSAIKNGAWEGETALINNAGIEIPVSQVIMSHKSLDGNIEFLSTIMRNITGRKIVEKALREAYELKEKIISASPIGIAIYNQTGQCIEANISIAKVVNATREQVLAQNYKNIESWKISGLLDAANRSIRLQMEERHEYEVVTTFGKHSFIDCVFVPFMSNGKQHLLLALDEITDRKLAEKDNHIKNSYLRLLQVAAVAANEAEDIKNAFLPVLVQICSCTGWEIGHAYAISENNPDLLKPTEVWCLEEKKQFMDFCSDTKKTDFARGVGLPGRVLASNKPHWIVDVTKDKNFLRKKVAKALNIKSGIAFPVMVGTRVVAVLEFFTTMKVEPDQPFMEIMADVGTQLGRVVERKQSKYVLEKNYLTQKILNDILKISHEENTLMELLEHAIDIILSMPWLKSKMGGIFMVESEPEVLVLKVKRNLPKGLLELCNHVPFGVCLCGDAALSGKILHSDNIDEKHVILYEGISPHGHYNVPISLDGKTIGLILLYLEEGHSRDDNEVMFLETLANTLSGIIKRKRMEEVLVQSKKMKAMGIMASGIAHEFNNILAVISSNAEFLRETNRGDKELTKQLHTICRMADDGAEIVDRMYDFTNVRKDSSRYISVDLNDLIKQVIGFTMPRWKEMAQASGIKYQIVRKGVKTLPSILGNPSELREVLLNIINNALDAMPEGGMITVKTRCIHSPADRAGSSVSGVKRNEKIVSKRRTRNSVHKSGFVEITFTDTGKGMSENVKKKIFDPFFTTRSPQGTGLGLSVSYGIITRHGGEIDVESELGKGCVISLRLPVTNKPARKVAAAIQDRKSKIDSLNILVVDDKKEICESLSKLFIEEGHKVRNADNGAKAIKLLIKNNYDLLLCDLVMPDVSGKDVIKALSTLSTRPKVGLMTGWRYKIEDAEKDGLEVDFIVRKPFNLSKLKRDINDLWS